MVFLKGAEDWTKYRKLPNIMEVDYHRSDSGPRYEPYHVYMEEVYEEALEILKSAQQDGFDWVLFRHGSSTSRRGKTTTRSMVRSLMRRKESTPYIVRSKSIQHETVFLAAVRPGQPKLKGRPGGKGQETS